MSIFLFVPILWFDKLSWSCWTGMVLCLGSVQLLPRQPFKCSKVSCRYDFSSGVNDDIRFCVSNGSEKWQKQWQTIYWRFRMWVTYPQIIVRYHACSELAVEEVMSGIDCSHTRVGVVVRIHAEAKWFVIPKWWCTPMTIVVTDKRNEFSK